MPIPIKVITSGAFAAALKRLAPLYEEQTGQPIDLQFGSSIGAAHDSIPTRLSNGQQFDILVLAAPALEKFILDGTIKPNSRIDLAGSKMAAAVRASDPAPDLSTLESFKQVLLSTPRIAYSASASGTLTVYDTGAGSTSNGKISNTITVAAGSQYLSFPAGIFFNKGLYIVLGGTSAEFTVVYD